MDVRAQGPAEREECERNRVLSSTVSFSEHPISRFVLLTCLKLEGGAVVTAAALVDSSDAEAVDRPAFQIGHIDGRGDGGMAGVVTSNLLGLHQVAEGSFRGVPPHPGGVGHAVQMALNVPGHARNCGGGMKRNGDCGCATDPYH